MIKRITSDDLQDCLDIIHKSFATIALDFGFTKDNCPNHNSFMPISVLEEQYAENRAMFILKEKEKIGYFSIQKLSDTSYELNNVSVLPEYRHKGYGKKMVKFAINYVITNGGNKIQICFVDDNTVLKKWYQGLGFEYLGNTKKEEYSFKVGLMEKKIPYFVRRVRPYEVKNAMDIALNTFMECESPIVGDEGTRAFLNRIDDQVYIDNCMNGINRIWGAFEKNKLVGMIATKGLSHLYMVFVDKDYHRLGIASAILSKVIDDIKIDNPQIEYVTINSMPLGVKFYHSFGFIDTDKEQVVDGIISTPMKYIFR